METLGAPAQPSESTTTTAATLTIVSKDEEMGTSEPRKTHKAPAPEPSFVIEDVYDDEEQVTGSSKA